ncbi:TlpA family protein disulfide reductase [Streptomyces avicenniae]|uniref:TlpA family protein disulfide reductase n=1 Tax=Streptomyces avicenniae TaxID=500153 RepID=UPI00069A8BF8|nr:TlpA disulfide reductase family protein [Streptomyces avicenniae]
MIQFRSLAMGAAGLAAGALTLTACTGEQAGSSGDNTNIVHGTGEVIQVAESDRQELPDIGGETVDGDQLDLADYRGDVLVLNVWGSWCAPCRAEMPHLVSVANDTADQGVSFVGLNLQDRSKDQANAFEERFDVPYPSLYDPDGQILLDFPEGSLNPQGVPSTLIVDREGRIAVRALKALTEQELRDALDPIIAEG